MGWKPIDFQGIVALDRPLVDQLKHYLDRKESQLGDRILNAIHPIPTGEVSPTLPFPRGKTLKLSDAVESFRSKVLQVIRSEQQLVPHEDWRAASEKINNALWDYAESLQGSVTELFQRVGQIRFERWHEELSEVILAIKDLLLHRIEDLIWAIYRMESLLWEYRWGCEARKGKSLFWKKALTIFSSLLDRSLVSGLKKNKKTLKSEYQKFSERYQAYNKLNKRIVKSLEKFERYHILKTLDSDDQKNYKKIYSHVKLWRRNTRTRALPDQEPVRALREAVSTGAAFALFKSYYNALNHALFERSRIFKRNPKEMFRDRASVALMRDVIGGYRAELHTLGVTFSHYREFLLRTDPDPYVRSRLGFTEYVVGPEPVQTRKLLDQGFEVERLDDQFKILEEALEAGPEKLTGIKTARASQQIQEVLHEMGQPLSSRSSMKGRAQELVDRVAALNELGSFYEEIVQLVGHTLSRGMRADWQFHVLHEIPQFHHLYHTHMGIVERSREPDHEKRLLGFKTQLNQVEKWVKDRDTQAHSQEIEHDISDMKQSLQDFFAHVQRVEKDPDSEKRKEGLFQILKQLLEYRYLFGLFFCRMPQNESEGKLLRNQFLFVDQYFESIETLIGEN